MPEAEARSGWYVVLSRVQCEDLAAAALERADYTVFLPRFKKMLAGVRIAHGRRIRTRGLGSVVERTLFPGYLFVLRLPEQRERPILTAVGVTRILRYPPDATGHAAPKLLAGEIVEEIRRRCDAGDFDQVGPGAAGKTPMRRDIKAGDQVRTVAGAVAELQGLDDSGRAILLMTWFGHERITRVEDARALELAAAGD